MTIQDSGDVCMQTCISAAGIRHDQNHKTAALLPTEVNEDFLQMNSHRQRRGEKKNEHDVHPANANNRGKVGNPTHFIKNSQIIEECALLLSWRKGKTNSGAVAVDSSSRQSTVVKTRTLSTDKNNH